MGEANYINKSIIKKSQSEIILLPCPLISQFKNTCTHMHESNLIYIHMSKRVHAHTLTHSFYSIPHALFLFLQTNQPTNLSKQTICPLMTRKTIPQILF